MNDLEPPMGGAHISAEFGLTAEERDPPRIHAEKGVGREAYSAALAQPHLEATAANRRHSADLKIADAENIHVHFNWVHRQTPYSLMPAHVWVAVSLYRSTRRGVGV